MCMYTSLDSLETLILHIISLGTASYLISSQSYILSCIESKVNEAIKDYKITQYADFPSQKIRT